MFADAQPIAKIAPERQSFDKLPWISPRPVLLVTGETAHSRHFSEQAFEHATEPKELIVVPRVDGRHQRPVGLAGPRSDGRWILRAQSAVIVSPRG